MNVKTLVQEGKDNIDVMEVEIATDFGNGLT
jgi:hypothetical protein